MARYTLRDFDYALPRDLIAQTPARERTGSRLLHVEGGRLADLAFTDLPTLVEAGDLLIFNDTRVIKSRLAATKPSGGRVELLLERMLGPTRRCSSFAQAIRPRRAACSCWPTASARRSSGAPIDSSGCDSTRCHRCSIFSSAMAKCRCRRTSRGQPTTPMSCATRPSMRATPAPWRRRPPACTSTRDCSRRSRAAGAVSAYVTLHVGAGTFQPVQDDDLSRAPDAQRVVSRAGSDGRRDRRGALARRARGRRRHDQPARARIRRGRERRRARRARPRPRCSSRRVTDFAWSTACSRISTCRNRRC